MPIISGGGGGAAFNGSNEWAQYGGESILPDSTTTTLDWGGLISGTALLDLTSTTLPTALVTGIYAVTVLAASELHAGGFASLDVDIDQAGIDMQGLNRIPLSADGRSTPIVTVVSFCPAGGIIRTRGVQTSGGPQTWDPSMLVQRIA